MSIINNGLLLAAEAAAAGAYEISRSLRFNAPDSAFLSRTPASAGNRKTWTWAGWVKRSGLGAEQNIFDASYASSQYNTLNFTSADKFRFLLRNSSGLNECELITTQVFRDPSSWYHIIVACDTSQGTASNRAKIYVNGVQVTAFDTATYPALNFESNLNNAGVHEIGRNYNFGSSQYAYFSGYLADVIFVDGQALDPTSFGEFDTNGVWQPLASPSVTYGTNGFHLPFSDNSGTSSTTLGKDAAGSNNWTPNNFSVAAGSGNDSLVDVPQNGDQVDTGVGGEVRGNYCTWNPLAQGSNIPLSNGNLDVTKTANSWSTVLGTMAVNSGKWYAELIAPSTGNVVSMFFGISATDIRYTLADIQDNTTERAKGMLLYCDDGRYQLDANGRVSYGTSLANGDILGIAYDLDNNSVTFYKNGSSVGAIDISSSPLANVYVVPIFIPYVSGVNWTFNFGARPFAYTAPSGFKALCTTNLPTPTIADGSTAMDVKLYTGNGSTQTISGLGFSPDLVWIKVRSQSNTNNLYDTIRGVNKELVSNSTSAEVTYSNTLTAFNSDGFSIGSDGWVNASSQTFVAWAWDAGSSTVTNTSGSISSQVRAAPDKGFSVVTYTGTGSNATVGHGLGAGVGMLIIKNRNSANEWVVGHTGITLGSGRLYLNTTDANDTAGASALWNSTAATSSVFSVGTNSKVNSSGGTYVAYVFSPVAGYSSFGSYTGNGSTDGPFVYTGFRPRWVLIKKTSDATDALWVLYDTARDTYNASEKYLLPNSSNSEGSALYVDVLSNGFKLRQASNQAINYSGATYIYAAFAEHPFQTARAR